MKHGKRPEDMTAEERLAVLRQEVLELAAYVTEIRAYDPDTAGQVENYVSDMAVILCAETKPEPTAYEALGWAYMKFCCMAERHMDPRTVEISSLIRAFDTAVAVRAKATQPSEEKGDEK